METQSPESRPYEVAVLLLSGYGERFESLEDALDYAEMEMHRVFEKLKDLEAEAFEGIYCTRTDINDAWRFDYVNGSPTWIAESPETGVSGERSSAAILPFRPRTGR